MKQHVDVRTGGVEPYSDHVGLVERDLKPLPGGVVPFHAVYPHAERRRLRPRLAPAAP